MNDAFTPHIERLNHSKDSLIEVYLDIQQCAESLYGKNTVVLMQVGSFFEVYGVDNEQECIGKTQEIAHVLNLQLTRKNKQVLENSTKNPLMAGFPTASAERYIDRLVQTGTYTIVIIEQFGTPPKVTRAITQILSPGVHLEYDLDTLDAYTMAITVECSRDIFEAGIALMDASTGKLYITSACGSREAPKQALHEIFRLLQQYRTKELILTCKKEYVDEILRFIEWDEASPVHIQHRAATISFQNELLEHVFQFESALSPIEVLHLERLPLTSAALTALLTFMVEHDERVLSSVLLPAVLDGQHHVYLGNNPLHQLGITHTDPAKETIIDAIDQTKTAMGRRLLRERILAPIIDIQKINTRYDLVDAVAPITHDLIPHLRAIYDLERLIRKTATNTLHPHELCQLVSSLEHAESIFELLDTNKPHIESYQEQDHVAVQTCIKHLKEIIDLDLAATCSRAHMPHCFFRPEHLPHLAKQTKEKDQHLECLQHIAQAWINLLEEATNTDQSQSVQIKSLEKEGYHLVISRKRFELIAPQLKQQFVSIDGTTYCLGDFVIKKLIGSVKISGQCIDTCSDNIMRLERMISAQTKEAFETFLQEITFSYQRALTAYTLAIAEIDVAVSTAITSATYGYHRPTLLPFQGSAIFEATALRHPLIERHEEFGVYIPNDFALGPNYSKTEQLTHQITTNDPRGALLFGINSSGKSSLMKSVGIAIVLAQAGHFVPAKTLNMTVMHELFTRIVSTDALERGLSSFAVEMTELKHIFYRATPKSMILGDELSHGTETRSAIAIVSAALEQFVSTGALFVCTTHLHELIELDLISTQHIAPLHLAVHYDEQLDAVVFDRTLRPGNGDTLYGLEFASSLRMNSTFLKRAMDIRKQLAQDYSPAELLIKQKKSTYNAQVLVSVCSVCNAPAKDVHHIIPQEEADTNGKADHIRIHHKKNLVPLCKQCHDNIHHGKLIINGYKSTSKGLQLDIVYPQKNA